MALKTAGRPLLAARERERAEMVARDIIPLAADHFGCTPKQIIGQTRGGRLPDARFAVMFLIRRHARVRMVAIGRALQRDVATVKFVLAQIHTKRGDELLPEFEAIDRRYVDLRLTQLWTETTMTDAEIAAEIVGLLERDVARRATALGLMTDDWPRIDRTSERMPDRKPAGMRAHTLAQSLAKVQPKVQT